VEKRQKDLNIFLVFSTDGDIGGKAYLYPREKYFFHNKKNSEFML